MSDLEAYARKRDVTVSREPKARVAKRGGSSFVIQKHAATRLHYDFRLELDGVLKSWAVPKGPSLAPGEKRLAVEVEDHPVDYRDFEGTIPEGQYGGGEVIVWDRGTWTPVGDPHEGLAKGHLRFELAGEKLSGGFSLVRIRGNGKEKRNNWLLLKARDEHAKEGAAAEVTERAPRSVLTDRTIDDIAAGVTAKVSNARKAVKPGKAVRVDEPDGASTTARASKTSKTSKTRAPARAVARGRASKATPRGASKDMEVQLATLVTKPPTEPGWVYEIKLDGYRALATIHGGEAQIRSRGGLDWTARFPAIAEALGRLRVKDAIVDGEICFMDADGTTHFQELQNALTAKDPSRLVYVIFDLLERDGEALAERPLLERKAQLRTILAGVRAPLRLSDHLEGDGAKILRQACALGAEGIIAKREDAAYTRGRSRTWLKIKCSKREEMVILGFTEPSGSRTGIGALVLGTRDVAKGPLRFVGKVGTGFNAASLVDLERRLAPLARDTSAASDAPRIKGVTWVEPRLVCEVQFSEWTDGGAARHPSFMGLREDKPASEVVRERAAPVAKAEATPKAQEPAKHATAKPHATSKHAEGDLRGVTISHEDRVLDEASGVTKGELARYYGAVAELLMPYAKGRPLSLLRAPTGLANKCFFQKHVLPGMGAHVLSATAMDQEVIHVSGATGILELAQFGVVELHGWGARLPRADKPDLLVIDLDPDEAVTFGRVIDAALETREALRAIGLESWVKTTGGKGLHVVAPLGPKLGWDIVKKTAQLVARELERRSPDAYTSTASKAAREGRIFVDYLRNGAGATAVLPYSARARPGMTVAMPIAWKDIRHVHPAELTVKTVPALLARRRVDPWGDLLSTEQTFTVSA